MRISRPRVTTRRLMIAVAVVALVLGSADPVRRWHRRFAYHRSQAAFYARIEGQERARGEKLRKDADDRGAIESWLVNTQGFAGKAAEERERVAGQVAEQYRRQARDAIRASERFGEDRQRSETAALWCWDPLAPDVP